MVRWESFPNPKAKEGSSCPLDLDSANAGRDADRYISVYSDGSADLETVPGSLESLLSPQTQKAHEVLYHGVTNQSSKENFISTGLFNLKSRTSGKCTTFFPRKWESTNKGLSTPNTSQTSKLDVIAWIPNQPWHRAYVLDSVWKGKQTSFTSKSLVVLCLLIEH